MRTFLTKTWWLVNLLLDAGILLMLVYRVFDYTFPQDRLLHLILAILVCLLTPTIFRWMSRDWKKLRKRKKSRGAVTN